MAAQLFDLIAFDGDDTLWHNERYYRETRQRFREILIEYQVDLENDDPVDEVEIRNLPYYGYGVMSFILSLIEAAIELTHGRISSRDIQQLLDLGKQMLETQVETFEHVSETLSQLSAHTPLMLITKGEPNHQLAKLRGSGLSPFFSHVEVVPNKTKQTYVDILDRLDQSAEHFMMVGNSLRSDIFPVLELGGWGVYVPHEFTWNHEIAEFPADGHERLIQLDQLYELPAMLHKLSAN